MSPAPAVILNGELGNGILDIDIVLLEATVAGTPRFDTRSAFEGRLILRGGWTLNADPTLAGGPPFAPGPPPRVLVTTGGNMVVLPPNIGAFGAVGLTSRVIVTNTVVTPGSEPGT